MNLDKLFADAYEKKKRNTKSPWYSDKNEPEVNEPETPSPTPNRKSPWYSGV